MIETSGMHRMDSIGSVVWRQLMLKPALAYPATVFSGLSLLNTVAG